MKTPGLIEALFQIDTRASVQRLCESWTAYADHAACMARHYPSGVSPEGEVILKTIAFVLIAGVILGPVAKRMSAPGWGTFGYLSASVRGLLISAVLLFVLGLLTLCVQVIAA